MNDANNEQETTFRDYLRVLFRHKLVMLIAVVTVCATVFIGLKLKTKMYVSSVKMLITAEKQVESPYYREMVGKSQQTLTQREIVKSRPVVNRVVQSLSLDKRPLDDEKQFATPLKDYFIDKQVIKLRKNLKAMPDDQKDSILYRRAFNKLKSNINVEPIRDTNMFTINVRDYNPVAATVTANVVSRAYVIFDLEQQLAELSLKYGEKHPRVNQIRDHIKEMERTLKGEPIDDLKAIGPASVKIMEQASIPLGSIGTSKKLTFLLAVVMSVFLAVMLAFIFEYMDQTFKTPQDIRRFLNLPFIGSIAKFRFGNNRLLKNTKKTSGYFKAYQDVADQICLLFKNETLNSLLITSPTANEGSPKIVANTGYYLAKELEHKVLIIDANLREAAMSQLLKVKDAPGLADYLEGKAQVEDIIQRGEAGPDVICAGVTERNPVSLLESQHMKDLIDEVVREYEIVLLDCANVRDYKDTTALSSLVDGMALSIDEGIARRHVVQSACDQLQENRANIKGVILNNRTFPIPKIVYENV